MKVAIARLGTYQDINKKKYKSESVMYVKTTDFEGYILKNSYPKISEWIEVKRISNIIWSQ